MYLFNLFNSFKVYVIEIWQARLFMRTTYVTRAILRHSLCIL